MDLDTLDRRILHQLEHRADVSWSDLARQLRRGRDTVEYRLSRLFDAGFIQGFHAVVDFYKLGLTLHKCYLRLSSEQSRRRKLINRLSKESRVMWIAECNGEWDVVVAVASRSMHEFYSFEANLLSEVSDILIASEVYSVIQFSVFRMRQLLNPAAGAFHIGEVPGTRFLSKLEITLLKIVAAEARLPISEIARRAGTSSAIARDRLRVLEQDKIILGYQAHYNLEKLNVSHFKAQFFLRDFRIQEEERFRAYCVTHPHVVAYIRQVGTCRIEVEFQSKSYIEYADTIDEIRGHFPSLIRDVRTLMLRLQHFRWDVLTEADSEGPR